MHDLDMDAAGAGDIDRLVYGLHDPISFIADVSEIRGVVTFQDRAKSHHFVRLGKAAWRCE
jgi:hypothetical protein